VKKSSFYHTPFHSTTPLGGSCQNIAIPFGAEKLEWWGYLTVKNFEDMCYRLGTILVCDRQTSCHGMIRTMHTHRAVKITDQPHKKPGNAS